MLSGRRARSDPPPRRAYTAYSRLLTRSLSSQKAFAVDTNRAVEVACSTCDKHDEEALPGLSAASMHPQPEAPGFGDEGAISGGSSTVCGDELWSNDGSEGDVCWHSRSDISQGVDLQLEEKRLKQTKNGAAGWWRACSDMCSLSNFLINSLPFPPCILQKEERQQQVRENGSAHPQYTSNDSEDDLDLEDAFKKIQVDVDCSDDASDLPTISELVEPVLEPDLQPYVQAGNLNSVSKRRSWADMTHDEDEADDIYEVERKLAEKVVTASSLALDMPIATNSVAPSFRGRQIEVGQSNSKSRRRLGSLIDLAWWAQKKQENGRAAGASEMQFCHQCGASRQPHFNFCRLCGAKLRI